MLGTVASLTVALAANGLVFGLLDDLLLQPPRDIRNSDRLVAVGSWKPFEYYAFPDFLDLARETSVFADLAGFSRSTVTVAGPEGAQTVSALLVTNGYLRTLGALPRVGRDFLVSDDRPGAPGVAILSHAFAQSRYGGAPEALGRAFQLAGMTFSVVGVMPAGFTGADLVGADVLLPIRSAPRFGGEAAITNRDFQWVRLVGRLQPSVSTAAASAAATAVFRRANRDNRAMEEADLRRAVLPVEGIVSARRDHSIGSVTIIGWLSGIALLILVMGCVNAAHLNLVRVNAAATDNAVRAALGASPGQLAAAMLIESVIVTGVALVSACGVALLAARVLDTVLPAGIHRGNLIDGRAALVASAAAIVALVASSVPAMRRLGRLDLASSLRVAMRQTANTGVMRNVALAIQVGLAIVVLTGTYLFAASWHNATKVQLGLEPRGLLIVDFDLQSAGYDDRDIERLATDAEARVRAISGVAAVGFTNAATFPGYLNLDVLAPGVAASTGETPGVNAVSRDFLEALGVPLLAGRAFTADEISGKRGIAIVSREFADRFLSEDPLGKCLQIGTARSACATVVGVVEGRRGALADVRAAADVYVPYASTSLPNYIRRDFKIREVAIRVSGDGARARREVQRVLTDVAPRLRSVRVRSADEVLEPQTRIWRFATQSLFGFATVVLILALYGIYATSSQTFSLRSREIAIRRALGEPAGTTIRLLAGTVVIPLGIGALIGLAASVASATALRSFLLGISSMDWRIYAPAIVAIAVLMACGIAQPLSRAFKLDPASTLRGD